VIPYKRNSASDESLLQEVAFDATRSARLLTSSTGATRVSLFDASTGEEFGSVPLADRSLEELTRAVGVVLALRERLQAATIDAPPVAPKAPMRPLGWGAGTPDELRPRTAFTPNFADKVETLARHIETAQRAATVANFRAAYEKGQRRSPEVSPQTLASLALTVEPGRIYWYLRTSYGIRRWAVSVHAGRIFPVNSKGVMEGSGGFPIEEMGAYDWTTRFYWPPKLSSPAPVKWVRSPLAPPPPKKAPVERTIRIQFAPNPDVVAWSPPKKLSADLIALPGRTGSMAPGWMGGQYEKTRGLRGAEIAKLIRADIKQAIADGNLPAMEFSVTTSTYAGGYSIDVRVLRLLASVPIINPAWAEFRLRNGHDARVPLNLDRTTPEAEVILRQLAAIHDRYNFDNSDRQTDYYNVRYSGEARFGSTLLEQDEFDALYLRGLVGWSGRRDAYVEDSLTEAFREDKTLRDVPYGAVRAYRLGDGQFRLQLVNPRGDTKKVLSEMDTPEGDLLESAYALAREFKQTKRNGRRASCRIAP
jgi:hypothetical protein